MKPWLLEMLRDPVTRDSLRCEPDALVSISGARYPILNGIPRFVGSEDYARSFGYQWNHYSRLQLDSASGTTQSRDAFLAKTGFALEELRGKTILDVGCGMGRFAEVAADAGARVVGVDLSAAVDAAAENLRRFESAAVVQADVFALPFSPESFDAIYSIGVLHHTPDTHAAFRKLPPLLKPGGKIAIWVYSRAVRGPHFMSRVYRLVTTRLSRERLMRICRIAGPLGEIQRRGKLGLALWFALPVSGHPDPEWRILDTFDWYSPRYQWTHTDAEVEAWFAQEGLKEISHGLLPVAVQGTKS